MVQDSFKKSAITMLVIYKMAAMIISYLNDSNYSFSDEDESENSGILGNLIYQTIFSLMHTCYLNACKLIKKLLHSLENC